jgi:hypothetical protein
VNWLLKKNLIIFDPPASGRALAVRSRVAEQLFGVAGIRLLAAVIPPN